MKKFLAAIAMTALAATSVNAATILEPMRATHPMNTKTHRLTKLWVLILI